MKSYTALPKDFSSKCSEFWHTYQFQKKNIPEAVQIVLERTKDIEEKTERLLGQKLEHLKILEIGPGQHLLRLRYFAAKNQVTGLDYDVIAQGPDFAAYWRMMRRNGASRILKTVLRKLAGIDAAYRKELQRRLGYPSAVRRLPVFHGDAQTLPFQDCSFDFVCSFSVFEHLENPKRCLQEIIRVLKPGGGFCVSIHLFTSENGCHDPRIFSNHRAGIPDWSHLRPQHQSKVRPNAYLNRWRLEEWKKLFLEQCPRVHFEHCRYDEAGLAARLSELRKQGELGEYSDDELLTVDFIAFWKKPA